MNFTQVIIWCMYNNNYYYIVTKICLKFMYTNTFYADHEMWHIRVIEHREIVLNFQVFHTQ